MEPATHMTVRIKRKKTTVFCNVEPTDTVASLKKQLASKVGQPADKQRLLLSGLVLIDIQTMSDAKVTGDSVLTLVLRQEGGGDWEEPSVVEWDDSMRDVGGGGRAYYE
mmetsp:Transcript_3407/g.9857  ORF Transcript_3407/g.9857 Transcript_3407/m.9857 type:complete len:109 (-) Transcript_3407:2082-2408(-)